MLRIGKGSRMSAISVSGNLAMFAATPKKPYNAELSVAEQTRQLLTTATDRLAKLGATPKDVMFAQIILADMQGYDEMNGEWDAWIDQSDAPTRACIQGALASPAMKVEMIMTVVVPDPTMLVGD